ncbi:probable methyltransferase PMT27 [Cucurbita pepo subsp. pepo]|uniref:probable methyltransferase PMT27 n=1 Tax=Cucurbita pepo subsp. pepo TaxID=3664 RepID=UPI000C9D914F|nr:probable methyltransferase PMT27 [Cucurbita pepo subsp. pepo]
MALGRPRSSKRSSSSSYASTVTTLIFLALCVLGIWMLTSTSVVPPQTTTRTSSDTSTATTTMDNLQLPRSEDKEASAVFEDNPGDLPLDAIKSDDSNDSNDSNVIDDRSKDNASDGQESRDQDGGGGNEAQLSEESAMTQNQQVVESQKVEEKVDLGGSQEQNANSSDQSNESTETVESDNNKSNEASLEINPQEQPQEQLPEEPENNGSQQEIPQAITNEEQQQQQQATDIPENSGDSQTDQQQATDIPENSGDSQTDQQQATDIPENSGDSQNDQQQAADIPENSGDSQTDQQQAADIPENSGDSQTDQQQAADIPENGGNSENDQQKPETEAEKVPQESEIQNQDDGKTEQQQQQQDSSNTSNNSEETASEQNQPREEHRRNKMPTENQESQKTEFRESQETPKDSKTTENKVEETTTAGSLDTSAIPKESKESKKSWSTQAAQSENEKDRRREESTSNGSLYGYTWQLCNVTAGTDYIPCLDNEKALKQLRTTKHFEHRERHCPEEGPTCLVALPENYKRCIKWPKSRDKIWYHNVPHTKLAEVKGHQNWVKVTGEFLTFPGGGTQFIHGALHYIDFIQQAVPDIAWGKRTRVVLDVGCGVASFGGYLFEKDVLTMSFAPKDEHEAQVQFALERGIPAISAVMGSQRLPFPSMVFDIIHCARCRVPWHAEGGMLLLELNRVLRPGGFFVWSATPVYQSLEEDVEIWKEMSDLTKSMCWELVTIQKDKLNSIGAAIYRKPASNECYDQRKHKRPPMCKNDDDPNAAWYVPLQACMHRVPVDNAMRGSNWPQQWPKRLQAPPYWLNSSQMGIYGKPAPQDFTTDYEHWKRVVNKTYMSGLGINLSNIRNVMDMRSVYGGFAAALRDLKVWVINVVNIDSPDTLPVIYERGLFGIYHDWCESFSTYPRTYDLLHADHLFSKLKKRCKLQPVLAEVDRIVRPGGKLIIRDESSTIGEVENLLKSLRWEVHLTFSKNQEGLLSAQKGDWRPDTYAESS